MKEKTPNPTPYGKRRDTPTTIGKTREGKEVPLEHVSSVEPVQTAEGATLPFTLFRFEGLRQREKEGMTTSQPLGFLKDFENQPFSSFDDFHDKATKTIVSEAEKVFDAYSWGIRVQLEEPLEVTKDVRLDSYWYLDYIGVSDGQGGKGLGTILLNFWKSGDIPVLLGDAATIPFEAGSEVAPPAEGRLEGWYEKNGFFAPPEAKHTVWRLWLPIDLAPEQQKGVFKHLADYHTSMFLSE